MTSLAPGMLRRRLWAAAFLSGVFMLINVITIDFPTNFQSNIFHGLSPLGRLLPKNYVRKLSDNVDVDNERRRPIMFTFVDQVGETDSERLGAWKEAWYAAGWQPRVLTVNVAQQHPLYKEINLGLHGDAMHIGDGDIFGFYRYMAIANAGGGWMSETDVFPLNPPKYGGHLTSLPNKGRFTVYEKIAEGKGVVPALTSGTAKEYNRIASSLYNNAKENRDKQKSWNDINALGDLHMKDPESFQVEDAVIPGRSVMVGIPNHLVLNGQNWGEDDCVGTKGKLAAHFTSVVLQDNLLQEGVTKDNLPQSARDWLGSWAEKCADIVPVELPLH